MIEELGDMVCAAGGFLADLVARIIKGIRALTPAALPVIVLGCQGPTVTPMPKVENKPGVLSEQRPVEEPKAIGEFSITFYYVIGEDEITSKGKPAANDNTAELTAVAPDQDQVSLFEAKTCNTIAEVSHDFAKQLSIQGTGKLHDGRVLNIWGRCKCSNRPCFKVIKNQWGTGGSNHPLQPFRTVAVDPKIVKLGSLLYVPLLEGRTMPGRAPWGGFVHDGCVVADDTGGHIDGQRLDLFVGRKAYYLGLSGTGSSHAWARHVPVYDGSQNLRAQGSQDQPQVGRDLRSVRSRCGGRRLGRGRRRRRARCRGGGAVGRRRGRRLGGGLGRPGSRSADDRRLGLGLDLDRLGQVTIILRGGDRGDEPEHSREDQRDPDPTRDRRVLLALDRRLAGRRGHVAVGAALHEPLHDHAGDRDATLHDLGDRAVPRVMREAPREQRRRQHHGDCTSHGPRF